MAGKASSTSRGAACSGCGVTVLPGVSGLGGSSEKTSQILDLRGSPLALDAREGPEGLDRHVPVTAFLPVRPHPRHPTGDEDHGRQPARLPIDALVVGGVDEVPLVAMAEQVRVEAWEQS